jgi:hypothetical protein
MLRTSKQKRYHFRHENKLYTDYLMVNAAGYATVTGLSNMMKSRACYRNKNSPQKTVVLNK